MNDYFIKNPPIAAPERAEMVRYSCDYSAHVWSVHLHINRALSS